MGCLVAAGGLWVLDGSDWLGCLIVYEVRVVGFADSLGVLYYGLLGCLMVVGWGVY